MLVRTGPIIESKQMKQCVYNFPLECGRCYIGETSRRLEVRIKKHKCNLTQGLLEKSKVAQHSYQEDHKLCWKEAKVLQSELKTHTENARKQPRWFWQIIRSVNPSWMFLPSGLRSHFPALRYAWSVNICFRSVHSRHTQSIGFVSRKM
jgi:predicted GIY-YIG superfamily endonuclease